MKTAQPRTQTWGRIMRTCGCENTTELDTIGRWLLITRACVQPMTITSMAIAGILAAPHRAFDPFLFALAAVGSLIAHAANNMTNDYFDLTEGLDTGAYPRAEYAPHPVLSGIVTRGGLLRSIIVANALDAAIMAVLLLQRGWPILAFALGGLFISVFYVAPPLRLKARGLGEPSVAIVWGPLMVGGSYYAATGSIPASVLWISVPYALLVTTVLMGKHIDKIAWDENEGVRTLPVLLGEERSRRVTTWLMAGFYATVVVLVATGTTVVWALAALAALPAFSSAARTYGRPKPSEPPARFPLWPLWFGPWAFVHARRAGALLVGGLLLGAIWPVYSFA
ncbi:MAG TPA: prenyltransferase [Actinomycetota bacterium]|jgi:1,4-dihydroxy-2-naphthoate octaprenyltransferase